MTKPLNNSATLAVHATCPFCGFDINILPYHPAAGDRYDNQHNGGVGGFKTKCESCLAPFVIEAQAVRDIQSVALVLLGEADPGAEPDPALA